MDGEGRYQEFNVSPTGAWWSCGFTAYRSRVVVNPVPAEVSVESKLERDAWEVVFSVPLRELMIPLEKVVGVHISAIIHIPRMRYLSSLPLREERPDFHRRECFEPIEWADLPSGAVST
jgi:hypothetical protein